MVCAIVSVNYYFDRYRGLASGLAMSGAGVGTLLIPVFYNWIIPIKGWRSSLLLYSLGASLLTALASLTLKPFITSDNPELTEQSTDIGNPEHLTSDQMLVMKTVPKITYVNDDVTNLPEKNHNRTVDFFQCLKYSWQVHLGHTQKNKHQILSLLLLSNITAFENDEYLDE
ncbi:unnamed protein product [Schistosoma margrebowiei]|uniref:Uncharacterized protein n=1 Tax=Schistosoma margrebowiei TaxID=48269 RepID=A0A183MD33_9TREM|nr:unnamed protein product [Schistosoma margrebowiei]